MRKVNHHKFKGQGMLEFSLTISLLILVLLGILVACLTGYEYWVANNAVMRGAEAGSHEAENWRKRCEEGNSDPETVISRAKNVTNLTLQDDEISKNSTPVIVVSLPECTPGMSSDIPTGDVVHAEELRRIRVEVSYPGIQVAWFHITIKASATKRLERFYTVKDQ